MTAVDELSKQGVPDVSFGGLPTPNPTLKAIATLAKVPILVVFGDHRDTPTGIGALPTWQTRFEGCQAFIKRITSAGGQAEMFAPPERGMRGNSHMIMQDTNNLQIADVIKLQGVRAPESVRRDQ